MYAWARLGAPSASAAGISKSVLAFMACSKLRRHFTTNDTHPVFRRNRRTLIACPSEDCAKSRDAPGEIRHDQAPCETGRREHRHLDERIEGIRPKCEREKDEHRGMEEVDAERPVGEQARERGSLVELAGAECEGPGAQADAGQLLPCRKPQGGKMPAAREFAEPISLDDPSRGKHGRQRDRAEDQAQPSGAPRLRG